MAECFNCNNNIKEEMAVCPVCKSQNNLIKRNFIKYIGDKSSLAGYQKSYKLVLLKYIIESLDQRNEALVSVVISKIRNYYLERFRQGLLTDIDVDERIKNIQNSTDYDVFAVIKSQPFHVINSKGFLFINRNNDGDLVFAFNEELSNAFFQCEFDKLLDIINCKLDLYYSTKVPNISVTQQVIENKIDSCANFIINDISSDNFLNTEIVKLSFLSTRTKRVLLGRNLNTIKDLIEYDSKNGINTLKIMGKKVYFTIIDLINSYHDVIQNTPIEKRLIRHLFYENAYSGFVRYCNSKDITTIGDLRKFDFNELILEDGFGEGKISKIQSKYSEIIQRNNSKSIQLSTDNTQNNNIDINTVSNNIVKIYSSNKIYSIRLLANVGLSNKYINVFVENDYMTLGSLDGISKAFLANIFGVRKCEDIFEIINKFSRPLIEIAYTELNSIKSNKDFKIYLQRYEKMSLQEIADINGCTRERVRQIESKTLKKLKPLMIALIENYFIENNSRFITEENVLEIFDDDDYDKAIIYTLKNCDELEYIKFAKLFIKKENKNQNTYSLLCKVAKDFVGDGIDLYNELDKLDELLSDAGFEFLSADTFIDLLIDCNAYFYGDYVTFERQTTAMLCAKVVEDEFKNGIHIYDENEISLLRKLTTKKYGSLKFPENTRALASALSRQLVLCDRGKFTSINNIRFNPCTIESIKEYIDNNSLSTLYYTEIFNEFQGVLFMTSNIKNYNCLHGVIQFCYPKEYSYSRDSLTKLDAKGGKESLEERINKYILKLGQAVNKKDLLRFCGCSEVMISNAIYTSNRLIQWEYNNYNTIENISIKESEKDTILKELLLITSINKGYCSDSMIYDFVCSEFPAFIEKNNILNKSNLFYILASIFSDLFDFRRPHICAKNTYASLNSKDIILNLLDDSKLISYNEFNNISHKMGWSDITSSFIFNEIEESYIRISEDLYINKNVFDIPNNVQSKVIDILNNQIEKKQYLSLINYDNYDDFPMFNGYKWNCFLLESIISTYNFGFKIVKPESKDRRYMKSIIVKNNSEFKTLDELVNYILKSNGILSINENELLSFLIINRLTRKIIPKEFYDCDSFRYTEGEFKVL